MLLIWLSRNQAQYNQNLYSDGLIKYSTNHIFKILHPFFNHSYHKYCAVKPLLKSPGIFDSILSRWSYTWLLIELAIYILVFNPFSTNVSLVQKWNIGWKWVNLFYLKNYLFIVIITASLSPFGKTPLEQLC